jgi:hypothetical protein
MKSATMADETKQKKSSVMAQAAAHGIKSSMASSMSEGPSEPEPRPKHVSISETMNGFTVSMGGKEASATDVDAALKIAKSYLTGTPEEEDDGAPPASTAPDAGAELATPPAPGAPA